MRLQQIMGRRFAWAEILPFAPLVLCSANGEIFSFLAKFFSAPSAPLREPCFIRQTEKSRRGAEGAERGRRNKDTLPRFAPNSRMEDLYLPSVFSVLLYAKVIHLREDFDR